MKSKAHAFFYKRPIFHFQEFVEAMGNPTASGKVMLRQHVKSGNVVQIKRDLYGSVPMGVPADKYPIDHYLIINALADDAVIAYHSALQFHGLAYSIYAQHTYLTEQSNKDFTFRQDCFRACKYPKALPYPDKQIYVDNVDHNGVYIKITSKERTLVDVLDRINLSGGLEEVWRCLSMVDSIDIDKVIDYARLLNNATINAKLGFYLSSFQQELGVAPNHLAQLKSKLPRSVHYLNRSQRTNGKLIKEWNVMIPLDLANKTWEEILDIGDI